MERKYGQKKFLANNSTQIIFSVAVFALLILICIPLFVVAKYNYISADDYGYGAMAHRAIKNGQWWTIFGLAAKQVVDSYQTWQGSFSAVFLFALQPGIWGEKYYQLTTFIIIFCLIITQFLLIRRIMGKRTDRVSWKCLWGGALLCLVQIFYVPYPEECFYWYNGSIYYTFFYTLQVLLFSEVFVLLSFPVKMQGKQWGFFCWMLFLSVIIGGGNLATGLSTALALSLFTIVLFIQREKHRFYIVVVTAVYLLSFAINVMAPGNAIRVLAPGYSTISPVQAVFHTIWHSMILVYAWTNYKMWLILLMAMPFLWQMAGAVIRNWKFTFRYPMIAMIFLFGIYASQLAPITYVEGSFGPRRMSDIMWFSYLLWLFSVEGYWLGWFRYRYAEKRIFKSLRSSSYIGIIQLCCLALWCILVLVTDVSSSSTYKACAAILSGKAVEYAKENKKREEVLHDPEIKDAYIYAIEYRVEPLFIVDISTNNQDDPNTGMAEFYDKNTVNLISE